MGMIINIDQALKNHAQYNVLGEPLHQMLKDRQEAWEKQNPIDLIFHRSTISTFQETYSSSIGFEHAFAETGDYAVGPIFNTAPGFTATYTTRTFQGSFIITQQAMEDRQIGKIKDDATAFQKRWHADVVEYCMTALNGAFGSEATWGSAANGGESNIKLYSADTTDGKIETQTKNPLFTKSHMTVRRENGNGGVAQSNMFYIEGLDFAGDDAGVIAKLADGINQIITHMENYLDDNGKIAGVMGAKTIVAANDAHLKGALENALSIQNFKQGESMNMNPAYQKATFATTPYLNLVNACKDGAGFFIVDKSYNAENHGPEVTERIPFTLEATETKRPKGIVYDGRQRFDVNTASWRGIAYVRVKTPESSGDFVESKFTKITPAKTKVFLTKTAT